MRLAVPLVAVTALVACDDDGPEVATSPGSSAAGTGSSVPASSAPGSTMPASSAPGTSTPTTESGGAVSAEDLDDRTFLATEASGHELVTGSEVRLEFADGSISGSGGCNSFIATPYSIEGDELVVEGPMGMTEMACTPADLMDQDAWLAELLTGRPTVVLDGDTLTLTRGEDTATFTDATAADTEISGTTWEMESLVTADAVSSVPAGVRTPTLQIEGDQIFVDTGCNTARGSVTVEDGILEIGPLATTRMACPGDAADVETHVLTVLDGVVDVAVEANQLTVSNGQDGLVLRAAS